LIFFVLLGVVRFARIATGTRLRKELIPKFNIFR
jgi:hypothetical protein